ncbi:hypothetical protein ABH920_008066 [Catenulispora sp. EB89]|uniref:DUF6183 family protein n=1 Tax=Catenulispora sp. EB89 TaxID=3156257 RepID=UPI003515357B
MADQIEQTIRSLRELGRTHGAESEKVVRWVRGESERRCADGDSWYLGDLGVALLAAHRAEPRAWQYLYIFDHLMKLLVEVSGKGDLPQTLRLIAASRAAGHDIDRIAAARLAAHRRRATFADAFIGQGLADDVGDTFRACLVHEIVLREGTARGRSWITEWAATAAMRRHPLGWLPLDLAGFERGWDRGPSVRGTSGTRAGGALSGGFSGTVNGTVGREITLHPRAHRRRFAADLTTPMASIRLSAAVMNWVEDSHGRIEARVFDLGGPVPPPNVPETLATLGLRCIEPGDMPVRLSVSGIAVDEAWWSLFHAALDGGAHGRGRFGAYSRLFAWRSLAALAGAPEDAGALDVVLWAQRCAWYRFDADAPWYSGIICDIGLVAVRPDGRRMAVLAATDSE